VREGLLGFAVVPVADPVADLAPLDAATAALLATLPGGDDVERARAAVFAARGPLAQVMRRAEAGVTSGACTPRQLAELWIWAGYLQHVRGYRSSSTVAQYVRSVGRLLEWAERTGRDFTALLAADFDSWQQWLALELRHRARWRMRQVVAVRGFYAWRASRGLGGNLAADLRGPREPAGMPKKYTQHQLRGMLAAATAHGQPLLQLRDLAMLLFLLATGARREEVSNVDIRDLELSQRTGLVRIHGKGAKEREVPFEGPAVEAMREWLLQRQAAPFECDQDAVFVGTAGIGRGHRLMPRSIERRVGAYARAAGLRDWGVHRFRVTFATLMYDAGVGLEEIRLLMGHESIETTRRYISVSERMRKTRLGADVQHALLGTKPTGQPRWMRAVLGEGK
jgi:site-specific recombinase XerD